MIYWALLLHFYQPPTQSADVLSRICDESYRPLIRVLHERPDARVTMNVNASVTEMLHSHGMIDVLDGLRELAARGQVEFIGTGKYHPILPLIPEDEARRQIVLNRRTNRLLLDPNFDARGFFPPEMAFNLQAARAIVETGHRWVIVSGVACPVDWPVDVVHRVRVDEEELAVLFRDDILSNKIAFQTTDSAQFLDQLRAIRGKRHDIYVVTALDAETFGHHVPGWETSFLAEVYDALGRSPVARELRAVVVGSDVATADRHGHRSFRPHQEAADIRPVSIGELLNIFPSGSEIEPKPSSWSTSGDDLSAGNPYPLWNDIGNVLHRLQWQHTSTCIDLVRKANDHADCDPARRYASIARSLLDQALHSCQYWWASRRPMWDVNMVHRGLALQQEVNLNAYMAISSSSASERVKTDCYYQVVAARDLAAKIVDQLFLLGSR